jgi:hypothetical protein
MKPTQLLAIVTSVFGLAIGAGTAFAAQAADAATEATASAEAQATASFSDVEVEQFARAALAVQEVRTDAAITAEDKPARLAAAVEQSGLEPTRFNEIAEASRSDDALMKQIQDAAAKIQQPAAAETSGAE